MRRRLTPVDRVGVDERAAVLGKRSIKASSQQAAIRLAISMVDLTTLEGQDTEGKVRSLAAKAVHPDPSDPWFTIGHLLSVQDQRLHQTQAELRDLRAAYTSLLARLYPSNEVYVVARRA